MKCPLCNARHPDIFSHCFYNARHIKLVQEAEQHRSFVALARFAQFGQLHDIDVLLSSPLHLRH